MLENKEQIIKEKQARLVRALLKGEETPKGFDDSAIDAARQTLARKRSRAAARTWPALFADSNSHERFEAYCRKRGAPVTGALLDGRLFARYLEKERVLTAEQVQEIARFDASYMVQGKELRLRNRADRLFRSALRRLTR
ncbi:MAG: hypothetical protein KC777_24000 [Cyanobacteria bacterium HKST-UBA02]|nr:hypothetical protein [Cyanobacteria bacterium HKST-UBA02]